MALTLNAMSELLRAIAQDLATPYRADALAEEIKHIADQVEAIALGDLLAVTSEPVPNGTFQVVEGVRGIDETPEIPADHLEDDYEEDDYDEDYNYVPPAIAGLRIVIAAEDGQRISLPDTESVLGTVEASYAGQAGLTVGVTGSVLPMRSAELREGDNALVLTLGATEDIEGFLRGLALGAVPFGRMPLEGGRVASVQAEVLYDEAAPEAGEEQAPAALTLRVTYRRLDGQELTEEQVRQIYDAPMSRLGLDTYGQHRLVSVEEALDGEESVKVAVIVIDEEAETSPRHVGGHEYAGTAHIAGLGAIQAASEAVY